MADNGFPMTLFLLANLLIWCNCAELQVLIDSEDIGRTTSCVGENVTYVCTVASIVHEWSSAIFAQDVTVAGGSSHVTDTNGFTFRRVSLIDSILTSLVSVHSFSGLDDSQIQCVDVSGGGAEEQTTTAMVFGAPELLIQQNDDDLTLFDLTITSPVPMPSCIPSYIVTPSGNDNRGTRESFSLNGLTTTTDEVFDVCTYTYNFTVVPNIMVGGMTSLGESVTVDQPPADLTGAAPITGLGSTSDGLVWSAPANAMGCSFQYMITLDADPDVSHTVAMNSVSFIALNASGFPTCGVQSLTVTPVLPITNHVLVTSSATIQVVIFTNVNEATVTAFSVSLELDIMIAWTLELECIGTTVYIQRNTSDGESQVDVGRFGCSGELLVPLDCSYVGRRVAFYVQTITGDHCTSDVAMVTTDELMGEECLGTGGAGGSVALAVSLPFGMVSSLLIGILLGVLGTWCVKAKWCDSCLRPDGGQEVALPPPNPVYDEVSHGREYQGVQVELKNNQAYGQTLKY